VDEDDSGLTFEEWDPSVDTDDSQDPVSKIVNSSELCDVGFELSVVIPLQLEEEKGGDRRTHCTVIMENRKIMIFVKNIIKK
jgi:hypothetical protein